MHKTITFLINILIPHLAGFIGVFFTAPNIQTWYAGLNKPSFNPPNWIFSPVWITLYTIIGLSFYLFHKKDLFKSTKTYWMYGIHITLNASWSIIFFGLHNVACALVVLFLMVGTILFVMKDFYSKNKTSFYLLMPYLFWLCFASALNIAILLLN